MTEETYTNYLGTFKGPRPPNGISWETLIQDSAMMERGEMPLPLSMYNAKYGVSTKKVSKTKKSIKETLKKVSNKVSNKVEGKRITFAEYVLENTPNGGFLVFDKSNTQVKPTNKPLVEIFNKLGLAKESKKAPSELTTRQLGTKIFKKLLTK